MKTQNSSNRTENTQSAQELAKAFAPCWDSCNGVFNDGSGLSSRENEEVHYRKHAIMGREWEREITLAEYRAMATAHLNSLDPEEVIELCQNEDLAVVKYNLDSGDLGIARRYEGLIKTFFRPNDVHYVQRKVEAGHWGRADIEDKYNIDIRASEFLDDWQKYYLFQRLQTLAIELPVQSHSIVLGFVEDTSSMGEVLLFLSRLGESRFVTFELQRRILTEAQSQSIFGLHKRISIATSTFEALEKLRSDETIHTVKTGIEEELTKEETIWPAATTVLVDLETFENALEARERLGYAMLELSVQHIHQHLLDLDLTFYEYRLRRSDIYLRNMFYQLAKRFNYGGPESLAPESFFWRKMASNLR